MTYTYDGHYNGYNLDSTNKMDAIESYIGSCREMGDTTSDDAFDLVLDFLAENISDDLKSKLWERLYKSKIIVDDETVADEDNW